MFQEIEPECAEELSQVVAPWQLTLRQLSARELQPRISFTALNDILVTHDRWQGCIHGTGGSAANYITIVGGFNSGQIPWNGEVLDQNSLACSAGDIEWEFVTPHGTDHRVVMLPEMKLADHMGLESSELFAGDSLLLHSDATHIHRFSALANQILAGDTPIGRFPNASSAEAQLEAAMLSLIADLLSNAPGNEDGTTARARYAAYRKAIRCVNNSGHAPTLSGLAAAAGVSVRVLQLAFQEHLGYSPYRYLRLCRLNQLHADLRRSNRTEARVTQLMERHGFSEFGRNAGEYRRLFGESPSTTLARSPQVPKRSIMDAISTRAPAATYTESRTPREGC